ncbi:MAG: DinB family protein [Acidimicrobiales bacterium]
MPGQVPPVADEREGLLAYVAQQRDALRIAAFGLTDEQARSTPTVSTLSVGGLIKHVTAMERGWIDLVLQRARPATEEAEAQYGADFQVGPDESLADLLADLDAAAGETDAAIAGIVDLGQAVPVPKGVPWYPDDVDAWSVRWVLLHLIEEIARHAGHADIVREAIDGATSFPLMAAAEGWPEAPWMQPWTPDAGS